MDVRGSAIKKSWNFSGLRHNKMGLARQFVKNQTIDYGLNTKGLKRCKIIIRLLLKGKLQSIASDTVFLLILNII